MPLFTVNRDKCKRDGLCAVECPLGVIEITKPGAFPSLADGGEQRCITCGHCVSVCPNAAFDLMTVKLEDCVPVNKSLFPPADQIEYFLRSRSSHRAYRQESIPRDILVKLIDLVRHAPSAQNGQPVNWIVVEDAGRVRRLSNMTVDWMRSVLREIPSLAASFPVDHFIAAWERGEDPILRGAPHVILVHATKYSLFAQTDCSIALSYLELAAPSLGLATCWAGALQLAATYCPPMVEELRLPEGHQCFGAMMLGYPKHEFRHIPPRKAPQIVWW